MATTFVASMFSKVHAQAEPTNFGSEAIPFVVDTSKDESHLLLRKIRQELNQDMKLSQEQATKNGVLKSTAKTFIPTSAAFAAAGGLIYFTQLMTLTHSDPTLMIKHFESLKDPIGHVSFGMFMISQGLYIDFKTKNLDPMTKSLMMRKLMYKGMAIGSLASTITADVLTTLKSCTTGWIENKNDEASHAACDQALEQWTLRNKTTQYVPQVMSLLFTQLITDSIELALHKGKSTKSYKKSISATDNKISEVFQLTGAAVTMIVTPGGPVVKAVKWLGNLGKFGMFLTVDHFVTPSVTRFGNNLLQPVLFENNRLSINSLIKQSSEKKKLVTDFHKQILSVTANMLKWRGHLNGKNELDLMGWNEATNKLLHQINYAKTFYSKFIENVFETKYRQSLINQGVFSQYPDRAWALQNKYPLRTLPLMGVTPLKLPSNMNANDAYLTIAYDIESSQSENIFKQVKTFKNNLVESKMLQFSKDKLNQLLNALLVQDYTKQGRGLYEINHLLMLYEKPIYYGKDSYKGNPYLNSYEEEFLTQFRKSLGDPRPQFVEGASYAVAFDTHTQNYDVAKTADFDLSSLFKYGFVKPSDLMIYQMICGANYFKINEGTLSAFTVETPRIINSKTPIELCEKSITNSINTKSLYSHEITVDGQKYENVTRLLMSKLDPSILGDTTDKNLLMKNFNTWWAQQIMPDLTRSLKSLDQRYAVIVDRTYQQIINNKGNVDNALDWIAKTDYLGADIEDNLKIELEFYLKTLEMILTENYKHKGNYFDQVALSAVSKNSTLLKNSKVILLKQKYTGLFNLFHQKTVSFDSANTIYQSTEEELQNFFAPFESEFSNVNEQSKEDIKSVLEIYKGLNSVLGEAHRYVMMKVQLEQKLSADVAVLNRQLKEQQKKAIQTKRGSAVNSL